MDQDLRKAAEKKVEAKKAFYITSIVFFGVSVVLLLLSFQLPSAGFWLRLPIPILIMVLGVTYISAFGFPIPGYDPEDWEEEAIQREMAKRSLQKQEEPLSFDELSEEDRLELKELERLKQKWDGDY